jgi:hypothetical protein
MKPHLCPKCHGQKTVSKPPWVPGDVQTWTSSDAGPYPCPVCEGHGVLWEMDQFPLADSYWDHPSEVAMHRTFLTPFEGEVRSAPSNDSTVTQVDMEELRRQGRLSYTGRGGQT